MDGDFYYGSCEGGWIGDNQAIIQIETRTKRSRKILQRDTTRTNGIDGLALICGGGCVLVENHRLLSPTNAISIECWVKTDLAGQDNTW